MSQPGGRSGTNVGDERHVLQALLSSKDILTLQGGPWVSAGLALVSYLAKCSDHSITVPILNLGQCKGKGLYLTVYPSSRPNTDTLKCDC